MREKFRTLAAARKYLYGKWAGNPLGTPYREGNCAERVWSNERGAMEHQCLRKNGFGPAGLYCKQHDPEEENRRAVEARERYEASLKIDLVVDDLRAAARVAELLRRSDPSTAKACLALAKRLRAKLKGLKAASSGR